MDDARLVPSRDALKAQARRLRAALGADGLELGHGRALELVAHQHGFKDWNTACAAAERPPPAGPVSLGARVRGRYLSQAFRGRVLALRSLGESGWFRVTFDFDEPVDVVTFASFSAFRRRVTCTIDRSGKTAERTSDGRPHLQLLS